MITYTTPPYPHIHTIPSTHRRTNFAIQTKRQKTEESTIRTVLGGGKEKKQGYLEGLKCFGFKASTNTTEKN